MEFSKQVNWQTHTAGDGYWSDAVQVVTVVKVELNSCNDEEDFGELRAYFTTKTWDTANEGLIYTDTGWINEFRALMRSLGFSRNAVNDIEYSEQGMQGDCFVSMDVGADFLRELEPMYRFLINREAINA